MADFLEALFRGLRDCERMTVKPEVILAEPIRGITSAQSPDARC